ncbi:MAG: hypothetical protein BWY59_00530 [Verrucomicrobia bacterium ADurb.Bin345]|nr:MAG: hypothetical protein BWY59_00530 [Verrucomicrobia bacterium ADurb.Bin345]
MKKVPLQLVSRMRACSNARSVLPASMSPVMVNVWGDPPFGWFVS